MIPLLRDSDARRHCTSTSWPSLRLRGFEGDISTSCGPTVFATDNSIYQVTPQAVVFPRNETDVVRLAKLSAEPRFRAIHSDAARRWHGNQWSIADQRHRRRPVAPHERILVINAEEGWARVQAGVVKDQLNEAIRPHGLFFAPELSPSNRATIGGMIATDASGQGSVLYGKTRDHVLELKCRPARRHVVAFAPLAADELDPVKGRSDRIGASPSRCSTGSASMTRH